MPAARLMEGRVLTLQFLRGFRFSCGKGDGGLRFGWETPPCGQRHMRSQGGAVYFPNHSAERGIRQEAPFFRL